MKVEPNGNLAIQYACKCGNTRLVTWSEITNIINGARFLDFYEYKLEDFCPEGWYCDLYPDGKLIVRCQNCRSVV